MGLRFRLEDANLLAHLLQPVGATPHRLPEGTPKELVSNFLQSFKSNYISVETGFYGKAPQGVLPSVVNLRAYFQDTPWVALLIPSGEDEGTDRILTSADFLRKIIRSARLVPGLILQLEEVPGEQLALDDVFPAFKTALADATKWPGILLWTQQGDSAFFSLKLDSKNLERKVIWIIDTLGEIVGVPDLALLHRHFQATFPPRDHAPTALRVLHLSDIHLGSEEAQRRLPRVKTLIRRLVDELGEAGPIVPVVTGDLMDSPDEGNYDALRDFLDFLNHLGTKEPIITLGNHDVREDGYKSPNLDYAINIGRSRVIWFDDAEVGIACFNSALKGNLARGEIGEREFLDVSNALDQESEKAQKYSLLALLHHHPTPVSIPAWYSRSWLERILGKGVSAVEDLADAATFLAWVESRRVGAVLHGHKHIPRAETHSNTMIIGCGSSVGKVKTKVKNETYVSMNVVTIDTATALVSARLKAERLSGGGLTTEKTHEIMLRSPLPPPT